MRVDLQHGYVLHRRPFSDSSLIIDCFTEQYGRLSLLAKGARSSKSRQRQLCQPFCPLLLSWQGKSDLKTLVTIESTALPAVLSESYLYSGLYLNELLVRVLPEQDSCPDIYRHYQWALQQLAEKRPLEPLLRVFELALLEELGYSVDFVREAGGEQLIMAEGYYVWVPESGFQRCSATQRNSGQTPFYGAHLLAIGQRQLTHNEVLPTAKRLLRLLLKQLLGNRPLQSRKLFTDLVQKPDGSTPSARSE